MKIKTMTASFGRLERETLALEEGLNIIQAPNEGGKSTWAGFLKAMLYGIDTRDRDKKGHLADKNRYQPWSGAPMEGEVTLEWRGRDITIRRWKQGSAPFGGFSAVYTGTQEPVPGMTGDTCGELLTGVGREVFERSAFIGQSAMAVSSAPELEKRIAALVSSGEEDVSYSQAEGRLREWLNRRQVNKTVGLIPKLEGELEEKNRQLERLEDLTSAIAQGEEERSVLQRARRELEGERQAHRRLRERDLNRRFAQAQQEFDQAQAALEALQKENGRFGPLPGRERLRQAQGELQYLKVLDEEIRQGEIAQKEAEEAYVQANIAIQDPIFNGMTGEEARQRAQRDVAVYQAQLEQGKKRKKKCPLALGAAVLLLALGLLAAFSGKIHPQAAVAALSAAAFAGFCTLGAVCAWTGKRIISDAGRILERYGADNPEQIAALAEDYAARWTAAQGEAEHSKQVRGALNEKKARRENGEADLFAFVRSFAPEVRDLFGCSAALSMALGMEDKLRQARERVELTRRRLEDLEAQGGKPYDTLEMVYEPRRSPQETEAALAAVDQELQRVERGLSMAQGEQKAVGDPAALAARLEQLQEQLQRRRGEYQAISVAMEALKAANAQLQERYSPALSRLAGEWLERLTAGRYTGVSLSRELEASATGREGLLPRKALALSRGTADQLYLAVRLAVCQLCLPGEEPAPLVLDDALAFFDDSRMALALDCLEQLGRERQVLLFTCQSREARTLEGREGVHFVSMGEAPESRLSE